MTESWDILYNTVLPLVEHSSNFAVWHQTKISMPKMYTMINDQQLCGNVRRFYLLKWTYVCPWCTLCPKQNRPPQTSALPSWPSTVLKSWPTKSAETCSWSLCNKLHISLPPYSFVRQVYTLQSSLTVLKLSISNATAEVRKMLHINEFSEAMEMKTWM